MAKLVEELEELSWGWKILLIIGGILIIKELFSLGFSFSFAL